MCRAAAHRPRRWTGLSCLAIVAAYVPPRGAAPERAPRFSAGPAAVSRKRARANSLAFEWRAADGAARLAGYREALAPQLTAMRERDTPGPAVLFDGPLPDTVRV